MILLLLFGCQPEPIISNEIIFSDFNNYSFSGEILIDSVQVDPLTDLYVDYSELTQDLLKHDLSLEEILQVGFIGFPDQTQEEIMEAMSQDELMQASVGFFVSIDYQDDAWTLGNANLSDMTLAGNPIGPVNYVEENYGTWMFMLSDSTLPGIGARMLHFVEPINEASNNVINFNNQSTELNFEVDLGSLTQPEVPISNDFILDWSDLSINGRGAEIDLDLVNQVMLGNYHLSVEELQSKFLDLELIADELYQKEVTSITQITLAELAGEDFQLNNDGSWIFALRCTTCINPAPPFLTVLRPTN